MGPSILKVGKNFFKIDRKPIINVGFLRIPFLSYLKGPKQEYDLHYGLCTVILFGPPHGKPPVAVIASKPIAVNNEVLGKVASICTVYVPYILLYIMCTMEKTFIFVRIRLISHANSGS